MPRKTKSQWEFGELFPKDEGREIYTVKDLTQRIRRLLEERLGHVWVTGEISNFRQQSSGHCYFTLKDAASQIGCVLFRGERLDHRAALEDGVKVVVEGDLTVYEPRGQYQLVVRGVEVHDAGALQVAFERLKRKLEAEGLFDPARKRPLPAYPQRIGIVTSPTGAALRDILHVVARRQPSLQIVLAPSRVQGEGAAKEIAEAIGDLNRWAASGEPDKTLDLILLGRGGGSLEDLWAFNEEEVARAIAASELPVVSAVGHEIDFTIADFVADCRAATPSVAAELITEGAMASRQFVAQASGRLTKLIQRRLRERIQGSTQVAQRLARCHPRRWLELQLQYLDDLRGNLGRVLRQQWNENVARHRYLGSRLAGTRPSQFIAARQERFISLQRRFHQAATHFFHNRQQALATVADRLQLLSPENVLSRGYSITTDTETGALIRASTSLSSGQRITSRLREGSVVSVVERRSAKDG